jgi:hypothetical protein
VEPPPVDPAPGVSADTIAGAPPATDDVVAPGRVVVVAPGPAVLVLPDPPEEPGVLALAPEIVVVVGTTPAPTSIWRGLPPPDNTFTSRKSSAQAPRK